MELTSYKPVVIFPSLLSMVLYGNRIITLNNGVRQEDQQWGLEHALNIDPFMANEIEIIKGTATVQYGSGSIGGVVRVNAPKLVFQESFDGNLTLVGQSNGRVAGTSIRIAQGFNKNWAYQLQLSGQKGGDLSAPDYILSNTGNEQLNALVGNRFQQEQVYHKYFSQQLLSKACYSCRQSYWKP